MDNKKTKDNLPKPKSVKKKSKIRTAILYLALGFMITGLIVPDPYSTTFLLISIPLSIAGVIINIKSLKK